MKLITFNNYDEFEKIILEKECYLIRNDGIFFKIVPYMDFPKNYKVVLKIIDNNIWSKLKSINNKDHHLSYDDEEFYTMDLYDFVDNNNFVKNLKNINYQMYVYNYLLFIQD